MKLRIECEEGEGINRWFYGFAYWDWPKRRSVFYPFPLNWLVQLWLRIRHAPYWSKPKNEDDDEGCNQRS